MDETHRLKEVEYYSAGVSAWYNTSLEYDKSLFTLSGGGVGLLITPLITVGVKSGSLLLVYVAALAAFLTCLVILLVVFRLNRKHLELAIHKPDAGIDPLLAKLDLAAAVSFGVAILCTAAIGLTAGITSYSKKEIEMDIEKKTNAVPDLLQKSFTGSGALSPQPSSSVVAPTPAPAPVAPAPIASTPAAPASGASK
jgi:hypothetical protein